MLQLVVCESQLTAVEPHQERGLGAQGTYQGHVLAAVADDELHVLLHIMKHLPAPLLALTERNLGGQGSHHGGLIEFARLHPSEEALAQLLIGDSRPRRHQAGHIEGLGGCTERDAVLLGLGAHAGKGDVAMSEEGHVAMNLVADDDDAALIAESGQALQRLTRPADAAGIVRIAQDEQAAMLVGHPCQVLEVHVVIAIGPLDKGVHHHLMPIALRHKAEWMIHRRLYDDLVTWRQQGAYSHSYSLDNAGNEAHPLFSHLPPVMLLHPADDGIPVILRQSGIAIEGILHPADKCFGDEGRRLPVHVGHPQREQVSTMPHLGKPYMLHIASACAVDGCIEIVCH